MEKSPASVAMVFAGGLGLAAYHAGAYQAFSTIHAVALGRRLLRRSSYGSLDRRQSQRKANRAASRLLEFSATGELSTRRLAASVWLDRRVGHPAHWQPRALSSTHAVDGSVRVPQSLRSQPDARANRVSH